MHKINKYLTILLICTFTVACNKDKHNNAVDISTPDFMVSTLQATSHTNIEKNYGYYCRVFGFTDIKNYGEQLNATVKEIIEAGKQQGANGLIGLQFTSINYNIAHNNKNQQVSKNINTLEPEMALMHTNLMQACGDMVKLSVANTSDSNEKPKESRLYYP